MATFGLTGSLRLAPSWSDALGSSTLSDATTFLHSFGLGNGTGNDQANCYWRDVRSVAAGATDTIDLTALPLYVLGGTGTMDMANVRLLYIKNGDASAVIRVSIAGEFLDVSPDGLLVWSSPQNVYQSGVLTLSVQNRSQAVAQSYDILLVGILAT